MEERGEGADGLIVVQGEIRNEERARREEEKRRKDGKSTVNDGLVIR